MILSKSCVYGLRASVYLASKKNDDFITIRKLSGDLNISFHFLTKVLQQLTKAEILESYKGPNGGVKLAKPAHTVSFLDVVISIDGKYMLSECILGLPVCGELKPCPLHGEWSELKDNLRYMMANVTLEDLSMRHGKKPVDQPVPRFAAKV
ncbi:MAG: Rrf2 family transcriptional regulator [Balneolaceae bacterium]|nr:MAG: Rrf2 family transcriptional regulator [Balneolaceae bacterium]